MLISRRYILALAGNALASRLFAASSARFDTDRLLDTSAPTRGAGNIYSRKYVASATVTLLSIPLVSKSGVGSGYTVIEEAPEGAGNATGGVTAIQFGAGSWPESARGLNRLGFIQETIVEERPGTASECAYLAFITTNQEKNLDQAKKALESGGGMVPYTAAQGCSGHGRMSSLVERLQFSSRFSWRDIPALVGMARSEMAAGAAVPSEASPGSREPETFLYAVRASILDPQRHTRRTLFFNSKQFQLDAEKEKDPAAGTRFVEKKIVARADSVMKLSATLTDRRTGDRTPFRLWYEAGAEQMPPLRFDYQAKSFLRLTFEADTAVAVPPIRLALTPRELATGRGKSSKVSGRFTAAPGGLCATKENA